MFDRRGWRLAHCFVTLETTVATKLVPSHIIINLIAITSKCTSESVAPDYVGCIPSEFYGTVYFPSMPVALFKDIARSMGNGTTINDVLLLCWSITVGRYIDELKQRNLYDDHGDIDKLSVLLPIGNPLQPYMYGDRTEGKFKTYT